MEPDSLSAGSTIVTAFQSGRLIEGGAALIGWAASATPAARGAADPRVSGPRQRSGGRVRRAAQDVADRRARRGRAKRRSPSQLATTRRRCGHRSAASSTTPRNGMTRNRSRLRLVAGEPLPGRCYLAYLDVNSGEIRVRHSTDSGDIDAPAGIPSGAPAQPRTPNRAMPVVRPDGTLLVAITVFGSIDAGTDRISVARSTDGGAAFAPPPHRPTAGGGADRASVHRRSSRRTSIRRATCTWSGRTAASAANAPRTA